ncbi:GntR family transcriptional regulator [Enterovirga rhinocerotis]|uniref:GntR family transcriptional regulator n=1 Tax=Enterovirga rhinocerotis TaxID=1339210 RepID=A0A4R7C7X5_9HYPH|nr:GntR family transcriptional regulator [Enterovirga rhinocerotis]TDR92936.1 GntR family transcriptional regulator [Enterovirga rhinocerotis]
MGDLESLGSSLAVDRSAPTLREQALEKLRKAVIGGELAPGTRLVERRLCDLLGVSRTVVREILRQLEAEGWIVNPPYKGPTVATVSADDARQIYEIREALEGLAARLCATRAKPADIKRLQDAVDGMAEAVAAGDVEQHILHIEAFYEALTDGAGHRMMQAYLASHRSRLARLRSISLSRPQRAGRSVIEKRRLLEAVKLRDSASAQRLAEDHVRNSREAALGTAEQDAPTPSNAAAGVSPSTPAASSPRRRSGVA